MAVTKNGKTDLAIKQLSEEIYRAFENLEVWNDVLRLLCETTGAPRGIIALRDRLTAGLIIPTDVREEFRSPLLFGFSEEEVGSYVTHYFQYDPWTEIEKLFHPSEPYALSKHVTQKSMHESVFWEWLAPQGISDSVVLDIGSSGESWVALNLFFPYEDKKIKRRVLHYTGVLKNEMRQAWRYGRELRANAADSSSIDYFLEQQPCASFLIRGDKVLLGSNEKASLVFSKELGLSVDSQNRIRIGLYDFKALFEEKLIEVRQLVTKGTCKNTVEIKFQYKELFFSIGLASATEDRVGLKHETYIVKVKYISDQDAATNIPIWNTPSLTKRERQVVENLATGKRVKDFQDKYGISKSVAHSHWGNAKRKLGVTDRAEVYAQHQVYLENQ